MVNMAIKLSTCLSCVYMGGCAYTWGLGGVHGRVCIGLGGTIVCSCTCMVNGDELQEADQSACSLLGTWCILGYMVHILLPGVHGAYPSSWGTWCILGYMVHILLPGVLRHGTRKGSIKVWSYLSSNRGSLFACS